MELPITVTGEQGTNVICTIMVDSTEKGKQVDEVIMHACSLIGGDVNPSLLGLKYKNGQVVPPNILIPAGGTVSLFSTKSTNNIAGLNLEVEFEESNNAYIELLEEAPESYTASLYCKEYPELPKRCFVFNPDGEECERVLKRHCKHLKIEEEQHSIVDEQGFKCQKVIPLGVYHLIKK